MQRSQRSVEHTSSFLMEQTVASHTSAFTVLYSTCNRIFLPRRTLPHTAARTHPLVHQDINFRCLRRKKCATRRK